MAKQWHNKALQFLRDSLNPIPQELNELDWKSALSDKSEKLARHISAFANTNGGGILAFGVANDASFVELSQIEIEEIVKTLGNIAKNNLSHAIVLDHAVLEYEGHPVLFVQIPEQQDKPVYLRGGDIYDAYIRSAGHTVKMSREQVRHIIALSDGLSFESRIAMDGLTPERVLELLDYEQFYKLIKRTVPQERATILQTLSEYHYCESNGEQFSITNMGAILFARDLREFPTLKGREMIVRRYKGTNNRVLDLPEYHHYQGYASGFETLISYIMDLTSVEYIQTIREREYTYPEVAIREFVANALVHQDFGVFGMQLTVEIFTNRIIITNPGSCLNEVSRLINLPPKSRNEDLAQALFLLHVCEKRGSGYDRAVAAIEEMQLPPYKTESGEDFVRVTMYPKKKLEEMTKEEKIQACYQHCCLLYEDDKVLNNQAVRERFGLDKNKNSVASRIISDTIEKGLLKPFDNENISKKFTAYIPFYG